MKVRCRKMFTYFYSNFKKKLNFLEIMHIDFLEVGMF